MEGEPEGEGEGKEKRLPRERRRETPVEGEDEVRKEKFSEGEPMEGETEGEGEGESVEGEGEPMEGEPEGEGETDILHPADLNRDWHIVLGEAIAYLAGWQGGSNLAYAIRAAYLWQMASNIRMMSSKLHRCDGFCRPELEAEIPFE